MNTDSISQNNSSLSMMKFLEFSRFMHFQICSMGLYCGE